MGRTGTGCCNAGGVCPAAASEQPRDPSTLPLPPSSCGSGLSGDYISEEGHYWIGMDISPAMLGEHNHNLP